MASYEVLSQEKNGKAKIKITVELGYNDRGKRIRKFKTVVVNSLSERVVNKAITSFEVEVANSKPKDFNNLKYSEAVELWVENHVMKLADNSIRNYSENIRESLDYFGDMKINNMKKIHFVEFKNHLISNNIGNAKGKFDVCKYVLTQMVEWDLLVSHPGTNVSISKEVAEMDFYDEKEVRQLFSILEEESQKYRVLIKTAILSGMRKSELRGLTIQNVDFKNNKIIVKHSLARSKKTGYYLGPTKNKKIRTLSMPEDFMKELKEYVKEVRKLKMSLGDQWKGTSDMDLVFCNNEGLPHDSSVWNKVFKKILKRNEMRVIRFHDLRHTHASLLLSMGEKMKVIQERLGHSSITITMDTYSHLTKEDEDSAANLLSALL